jgi:twitching motility protein PilT
MTDETTLPQSGTQQPTPTPQTTPTPTNGNDITADPVKYLEYLFDLMIKYKSSDIYLTYGEEPTLRIFGEARRIPGVPKLEDRTLNGIAEFMMNEEDKRNYKENLSADLGISMHGRRYRVNISRQRDHIMIVARLLEEKVPTIDERKLPQIFKQLTNKTNGIIFVAGPTGSGKSTTLAAMIEEININKAKHIITIEDPIEYVFDPKKALFEQKQLGKDIVTFASAMKYALRQRPDVILFGEARDPDSLRNAIALAETGHLVLTTIHSRSAEQTINKIIAMFPADEQPQIRNQVSENMTAIIIQKLIRTKDGQGMVPAHEILLNNTAVENTIRENKLNQIKNVMYTNRNIGMQLLEDDLVRLVEEGKISPDAAMANANDHAHVQRELQAKSLL